MTITFDERERAALADAGIAVFEDRIVLEAQPPASDEVLAEVAARCAGELPADLLALWRTAFGGTLDYDLRCDFGGHEAALSFRELFYPKSGGYRDIWGWIEHEDDLASEVAEERGEEWSGVLDALPIGGFEYLDRIYVVTRRKDHGSVWAWMKGLPPAWRFELHRNSLARVAGDVRGLFRALALESDPWTADPELHPSGLEIRDAIENLPSPALADKLRVLVRSTVLDWRGAIEDRTIANVPTLRRLALEHAARADDVELLERLVRLGCDASERVRASSSAIDFAFASGSMRAARWLLDRGVPVENTLLTGARKVDLDLARELIARGARVDEHCVAAAIDAGRVDVAHLFVEALGAMPSSLGMAIGAREQARRAEERAARIETGELISNISPDDERARGARLRELADRLDPTLAKG